MWKSVWFIRGRRLGNSAARTITWLFQTNFPIERKGVKRDALEVLPECLHSVTLIQCSVFSLSLSVNVV